MTISSLVRKAGPFQGNATTTVFPFAFKVFTKADVKVLLVNAVGVSTTLTLDSDYSVALSSDQDATPGGSITYPISGSPLPLASALVMLGNLADLQPTDLTNTGGFYPSVIEDMVDRSTIQIQQLAENLSRAITITEAESALPSLPNAVGRANMVLGFDSQGNPIMLPLPAAIGAGDMRVDVFISDTLPNPNNYPTFTAGVTASLSLSRVPGTVDNTLSFFDTGYQGKDQIQSLVGDVLTYTGAIPLGISHVYVQTGTQLSVATPAAGSVTDASVAVGSKLYVRIHDEVHAADYGAVGDGVADDTAAIQAAANAAGANGTLFFGDGTYKLSATLNALAGQSWISNARGSVVFRRYTDYGDTLKFAAASFIVVRGIWMFHGTSMLSPGDIALTNLVASNSAHIRLQNAQVALIEDCILWRMPYGIAIDQGSLVTINRCHAQGTWDGDYTAAQEGIAGIQIGGVGYTQIVKITDCYLAGSGNGPRNVTFTSSDTGAHVLNFMQNVGNQYGVEIVQCEDLLVSGNYVGGNWNSCIFANLAAGSVNLDWRFVHNLLDGAGAGGALMYFTTQADGTYATQITIANNVLHGELQTLNALVAYNPHGNNPAITGFNISDNTTQATIGSAMLFYHARGGKVADNTLVGYNAGNCSAGGDLGFCAGAVATGTSSDISFDGNHCGGGVNAAGSPSFCYDDINIDTAPGSVVASNTFIVGGGLSGTLVGRRERVVTVTVGNYVARGNEKLIVINKAVGAATQITAPANVPVGHSFKFKDGKGDAAANNIQLIGEVDNVANPVYSTNLVAHELTWTGTQWNVTG